MKAYFKLLCVACLCALASCTDNTGILGITDKSEAITSSTGFYNITSETVPIDSVTATSLTFFLGQISDTIREEPVLVSDMNASFVAQLFTQEGFSFPKQSYLKTHEEDGHTYMCDSTHLEFYFDEWYGEYDNPLKVSVYRLKKTLEEGASYYTSTDYWKEYVDTVAGPMVSKMVTPCDYINTWAQYSSIKFDLGNAFGQEIMDKFYAGADPSTGRNPYFESSFYFNHNVFPGFYVTSTQGLQSMYTFYTGALEIYYHFQAPTDTTEYEAEASFTTTPEVLVKTEFSDELSDIYDKVKDDSCTYIKSPAGLATRLTLPVDEMYAGEHSVDTITKLQVSMIRYNKDQDQSATHVPSYLLMVRETDVDSFFVNHKIPDSQTSFLATINDNYNSYTYSNICLLVSYMRSEKATVMKRENLTSDQYNDKYREWNKVILLPVDVGYDASSNVTSCDHDLNLRSARLVGGKGNPILVQVYYSRFNITE